MAEEDGLRGAVREQQQESAFNAPHSQQKKKKKKPPEQEEQQQSAEDIEDFQCPICMQILIKPITLQCHGKHTLCTPCFEALVQKTSMECPLCKQSIHHSWVRLHKTADLINMPMWQHIQLAFPEAVRLRTIQDEQGASCSYGPSAMANIGRSCKTNWTPQLAKPGEIGEEFRAQAAKLAKQMQTKENEQRLREMRMVELVDDVLAHKIQNLNDTSAVEEVLGEWDAVMADVQQQLGDDQLTSLNSNDVFKQFYGTELVDKKKEGPILYPPEEEEQLALSNDSAIHDDGEEQDIFAELGEEIGNAFPIARGQSMSQSSQYSVELGGSRMLRPATNSDSLLFTNPAFVAPISSNRPSDELLSASQMVEDTGEMEEDSTDSPVEEVTAVPPVDQQTPADAVSFLGPADVEDALEPAEPARPASVSRKKTQRNETDDAEAKDKASCSKTKTAKAQKKEGTISKEAVRKMLSASPQRRMGGQWFKSKKLKNSSKTVPDSPETIDTEPIDNGVTGDKTLVPISRQPHERRNSKQQSRKRAMVSKTPPPEIIADSQSNELAEPPSPEQQPLQKSARGRPKKGAKGRKSNTPLVASSSASVKSSVQPPKEKRRRTVDPPVLGDSQDVLDKKLAEALQLQFNAETNSKMYRVNRELGSKEYYNFRRKSQRKSFVSTP